MYFLEKIKYIDLRYAPEAFVTTPGPRHCAVFLTAMKCGKCRRFDIPNRQSWQWVVNITDSGGEHCRRFPRSVGVMNYSRKLLNERKAEFPVIPWGTCLVTNDWCVICCDNIKKYSRPIGFLYFYRPINIILSADSSDYI